MYKSLRNFFVAIGFACYFTSGGVALAKNAESWLAPVCYHDLPEYGNYRWNCLLPPPPVPDDYPTDSAAVDVAVSVPAFASAPEAGSPPMPVDNIVAEVSEEFSAPEDMAPLAPPAYFSATDIRRRDWWTPTFVVTDSPLVTPPVVDESCHTQWYGCEEEAMDSYALLEAAMFAAGSDEISEGDVADYPIEESAFQSAPIPVECVSELMAAEWMMVQESLNLAAKFDLAVVSEYAAEAIATSAPWLVAKPVEIVVEDLRSEDAIADELFASEEMIQDNNATVAEDKAAGFTAYTCMIPYSLTANAEESPNNYAQAPEAVNDVVDDRVETAAAMQKLARQLDWVGLNILRVADHLDSWANQALLRHRAGQVR